LPIRIRYEPLDALAPDPRNARTHTAAQISQIERSLVEFGWTTPAGKADGVLIYGHARREAAMNLRDRGVAIPGNPDPNKAPVVDLSHLTPEQRRAYAIADNQLATLAGWNEDVLRVDLGGLRSLGFDLSLTGFPDIDLVRLLGGQGQQPASGAGNLAEAFGVPPFSVLNAREGWWQDRKRAWLALGIQSELGRGENLQGLSEANDEYRFNKDLARIGRGKKANAIPGGAGKNSVVRDKGKAMRGRAVAQA